MASVDCPQRCFVTGIGTDVGKTVVAAILCKAWGATYWKPVQAGDLDHSDTIKLQQMVGTDLQVLPETHRLQTPASPHYAAAIDQVSIHLEQFSLPGNLSPDESLVVEGAGGLLVPLNNRQTMVDLAGELALPVVLVSRHYLGSINHTLMSLEVIKKRGLPLLGVVFVGDPSPATEEIIVEQGELSGFGRVPLTANVDAEFVTQQAQEVSKWW